LRIDGSLLRFRQLFGQPNGGIEELVQSSGCKLRL
jgi:hypothetical protein